jgi:hypothetical protein
MSAAASRSLALLAAACLLTLALFALPASAQKLKQPKAGSALKTLVRQTKALPRRAATKRQKTKLLRAARSARKSVRKRPCKSVRQLSRYRRILGRIKVKRGRRNRRARNRLSRLAPTSMTASRALLSSRRTRSCGGGRPNRRHQTTTQLLQSDANGMRIRVQLPALRFASETGGGKTWTKLVLPNTDSPGAPGTPGIPTVSNTFAVPDGATVKVTPTSTTSYTLGGVDVFPVQPEPLDQGTAPGNPPDFDDPPFAAKPFEINRAAYRRRGNFPDDAADGGIMGTSRDVTIGNFQVPAAQYKPRSGTLKVFTSIDVTVNFQGGTHQFSEQLNLPWERPQQRLLQALINRDIVQLRPRYIPRRCGEEMLVITNPATLAAANQFAIAKRGQGMRTNVVQTGAGAGQIGTTPAQIQAYIRGRLNAFLCVHPSYVTIMGDDDLVPTFPGINGIPSDLQYSMRNDTDELPDVAVGRIIGNDNAAVTNAVTKIVSYENSPPGGAWLNRATIAAQFQDDNLDGQENRTFITYAETVRNGLVARGNAVDRIYDDSPTATPLKFNDGTDLPAELKKPTFAWDGDGADVSAAWNEGRFLVAHRDHGWSDGWGHPGFQTSNVQALTNGNQLPVVMSINCSSGAYDYDETSFAGESLVKANGGSVGVFGDTRDSPSWHNTQIALGFIDGLLPSILPSEGPPNKQRTGDALITGKLRLAGLAPPATDGSTRNELYLWHYFGDPSMQMWGGDRPPFVFDPNRFTAVFSREIGLPPGPDPPPYVVNVTLPAELNGQPFSLLRNGQVIGKAFAADGRAKIAADFGDGNPKPGELEVVIEPDGGKPVTIPVSGVPAPPAPEKTDTTLSIECPADSTSWDDTATINGRLDPAFAGAAVELTYTNPRGETIVRSATTDASGNWSDAIDLGVENDPNGGGQGGTWQVSARYAGDSTHDPSGPVTCTFDESGS